MKKATKEGKKETRDQNVKNGREKTDRGGEV